MQFIERSQCPELLANNKEKWTAPWVAHYRWQKDENPESKQPKKPTDGHWRNDEIRLPLIKDFHNNCGYCGESVPTPQVINEQEERASKGDVDHLLPKSIEPEKVYDWNNYIWSCKPCNQHKQEFYSLEHPLLNPCSQDDCSMLMFVEDTGQYMLNNSVANDEYWLERIKNSEQKTMINAEEICKKRRLRISSLRHRFESIVKSLNMMNQLNSVQQNNPVLNDYLQVQINDYISEISEITISPDFYYLLQEKYKMLLQQYPQVAVLLKQQPN